MRVRRGFCTLVHSLSERQLLDTNADMPISLNIMKQFRTAVSKTLKVDKIQCTLVNNFIMKLLNHNFFLEQLCTYMYMH